MTGGHIREVERLLAAIRDQVARLDRAPRFAEDERTLAHLRAELAAVVRRTASQTINPQLQKGVPR